MSLARQAVAREYTFISLFSGHRFHCTQCDFSAKRKSHLKDHVDAVHDNVRYPCDQCDVVYTSKANLKKHKLSRHEVLVQPIERLRPMNRTTIRLKSRAIQRQFHIIKKNVLSKVVILLRDRMSNNSSQIFIAYLLYKKVQDFWNISMILK